MIPTIQIVVIAGLTKLSSISHYTTLFFMLSLKRKQLTA